MACFLVPLVAAVIMTLIQLASRSLAEKLKLGVLNSLLWGGAALLALEHMWHGEVVPWPPFLTAMANPLDVPIMLHEMATVGTAMTIAVLATWGITLAVSHHLSRLRSAVLAGQLQKPHTTLSQQ